MASDNPRVWVNGPVAHEHLVIRVQFDREGSVSHVVLKVAAVDVVLDKVGSLIVGVQNLITILAFDACF